MGEELIGFWKNLSLDSIKYIDPNGNIEKVEQWKDIDGWEGYYMISDLGRIKSMRRIVMTGSKKDVPTIVIEKIIKQSFGTRGYLSVSLSNGSNSKTFRPNILVANAFIPNKEGKPQVNHIKTVNFKAIKTLNAAYNLEWATPKENTDHAVANGLYVSLSGELNGCALLTNEQAVYIFNSKETTLELSKRYGVDIATIQSIKTGARWGKVTNKKYKAFPFLTKEQVLDIYYSKEMGTKLAIKYGVTKYHISRIRTGKKCSSITGHKKS